MPIQYTYTIYIEPPYISADIAQTLEQSLAGASSFVCVLLLLLSLLVLPLNWEGWIKKVAQATFFNCLLFINISYKIEINVGIHVTNKGIVLPIDIQ